MLTNYYTLRQLVIEWSSWICDARIVELYSQKKGELSILIEDEAGATHTISISVQAPLRYLTRSEAATKAKKNVAEVLPSLQSTQIKFIAIDENDRLVECHLADQRKLRIEVFGPSANVYLIDAENRVLDSFRKTGYQVGEEVTQAIARPEPEAALSRPDGSVETRARKAFPNLGRWYVEAALVRSNLDPHSSDILTGEQQESLAQSVKDILIELDLPTPVIYWKGPNAHRLSLIPLNMGDDFQEETYSTVDEAVRVYVRRKLSQTAYDKLYSPLHKSLHSRLAKAVRSRDRMRSELEKGNRADQHEQFGHLLMSMQSDITTGAEAATLPNIISGEGEVTIPLSAELSAVQNAERYYARARASRQARSHLKKRIGELDLEVARLQEFLEELSDAETVADVRSFIKKHAPHLDLNSGRAAGMRDKVSYRTYELGDGYEVWVGRNATQNDRLTTQDARKYDLWLHARGVAGSHTVLRIPRRQEKPPTKIVEKAASIAAFHSKARSSEFAPVIVTEKRYVRKPRKSPLGTVIVEREEVLIVRPELPKR